MRDLHRCPRPQYLNTSFLMQEVRCHKHRAKGVGNKNGRVGTRELINEFHRLDFLLSVALAATTQYLLARGNTFIGRARVQDSAISYRHSSVADFRDRLCLAPDVLGLNPSGPQPLVTTIQQSLRREIMEQHSTRYKRRGTSECHAVLTLPDLDCTFPISIVIAPKSIKASVTTQQLFQAWPNLFATFFQLITFQIALKYSAFRFWYCR